MDTPTAEETSEIEARADQLERETLLTASEAEWWAYRERGYRREEIAREIGRAGSTVDTRRQETMKRLGKLWRTIDVLELEEGQTEPDV